MELPDPVRQRLGNFSRTMFSDSNRTGPEYSEGPAEPYSVLPDYYKFIVVTVIILVTLIEVIRLYLGYMGNLQEKVPELAGFWLLSLLLQLPLILFLLFNEGLTNLPLEKAVHIIFTTFLTFQVISAFLTMRKMVNQLATRFHLQDFDRLSESRGGMRRMRSCLEEI
ncbi:Transmembrane protein 17 [Camelus dromedarius]|uniref:Transmembrane protein 17 n=1 Tax=Camelus dromedarius TaxID=9838 RepID=A0A5N4D8F2_CAMDR|nr:Transmembrane protein 17 [Camelus dromedarius]